MKYGRKTVLMAVLLMIVLGLTACSIPGRKPEGGVWYCEELMLEIDFDAYNANGGSDIAQKYDPDGTCQNVLCRFDYGTLIVICSEDQQEIYLTANFSYRNGVFQVKTTQDKITYVFERIDTLSVRQ